MASKAKQISVTEREGLTGRDDYILSKSSFYAIATIQALPKDCQEWSDMRDMCIIARDWAARSSGSAFLRIWDVYRHTGLQMTLWPEPDAELTAKDREQRDDFEKRNKAFHEQMMRNLEEFAKANPIKVSTFPRVQIKAERRAMRGERPSE